MDEYLNHFERQTKTGAVDEHLNHFERQTMSLAYTFTAQGKLYLFNQLIEKYLIKQEDNITELTLDTQSTTNFDLNLSNIIELILLIIKHLLSNYID